MGKWPNVAPHFPISHFLHFPPRGDQPMRTYRVAVLGCRARGTAAARAYAAHPRTAVAALCDLVPERMAVLGEELGVAARYTDMDRMLREERPDIVAVPTATDLHYELSARVLEYGAHVDVE